MRNCFILLLVLLLFFAVAVFLAWRDFTYPSNLEQDTTIIIPPGNGFQKSVDLLSENKIIAHSLLVKLVAYATGDARRIKAGEYRFSARISPQEVLRMLVAGQVVKHKITIAEGLNVREIVSLLQSDPVLVGDIPEFIEEGSLFPETYYFIHGDTRALIVNRMQGKMQQILAELWEKRADNLPLKNKQEALILASIVEKETGVAGERERVAAVFVNRLKIGMKLQSDPTTVYGIEQAMGKRFDRSLIIADLKESTPYNTYIIAALPPTPITNPGRAAIEAVLHPLQTNELYFVATGKGGHNFSSTFAEHEVNIKEYRARNAR